jgi:hypothetical protein
VRFPPAHRFFISRMRCGHTAFDILRKEERSPEIAQARVPQTKERTGCLIRREDEVRRMTIEIKLQFSVD